MSGAENRRPTPADLDRIIRHSRHGERQVPAIPRIADIVSLSDRTPLADIPRPYQEQVSLLFGHKKDAVLVDSDMLLRFRSSVFGRKKSEERGIWVTRDRTLKTVPKNDRPGRVYYPVQDESKGVFGSVFMTTTPDRPAFYVSEKYEVTLLDDLGDTGIFRISSTQPIETRVVSEPGNGEKFMQSLNRNR